MKFKYASFVIMLFLPFACMGAGRPALNTGSATTVAEAESAARVTPRHLAPAILSNQAENTCQREETLLLLGTLMGSDHEPLVAHVLLGLMNRGMSATAVALLRDVLREVPHFGPGVALQPISDPVEQTAGSAGLVVSKPLLVWRENVYTHLTAQEIRILESYMRELLCQGLTRWHYAVGSSVVQPSLRDTLYTFSYIVIDPERKVTIHTLEFSGTTQGVNSSRRTHAADAAPLKVDLPIPPLLHHLATLSRASMAPGVYLSSSQFAAFTSEFEGEEDP